jgi:hypothetical protein
MTVSGCYQAGMRVSRSLAMRADTEQVAYEEQRAHADALAGKICAAAEASRSQSVLLELVGECDGVGAIRYWTDFKSLAHCGSAGVVR